MCPSGQAWDQGALAAHECNQTCHYDDVIIGSGRSSLLTPRLMLVMSWVQPDVPHRDVVMGLMWMVRSVQGTINIQMEWWVGQQNSGRQ